MSRLADSGACRAGLDLRRACATATCCCTIRLNPSSRWWSSCARRCTTRGAGDQADHLPHRQRIAADGGADRGGAARQGSDGGVELKARFDEEANINWAERLEAVGAQVVYGIVGLKTHAKLLLVTRREGARCAATRTSPPATTKPKTARLYTDIGCLTADRADGRCRCGVPAARQPGRDAAAACAAGAPFTLHRRRCAHRARRRAARAGGRRASSSRSTR